MRKLEDLKFYTRPTMSLDWPNLLFGQCRLTYIDLKYDKNLSILGFS